MWADIYELSGVLRLGGAGGHVYVPLHEHGVRVDRADGVGRDQEAALILPAAQQVNEASSGQTCCWMIHQQQSSGGMKSHLIFRISRVSALGMTRNISSGFVVHLQF